MTKYFHDKISLLKKCSISGKDAISCIIKGLPLELRPNVKAYQCQSPEELYHVFLAGLENYKTKSSTWKRGSDSLAVLRETVNRVKRCYNCRRAGHEARDCWVLAGYEARYSQALTGLETRDDQARADHTTTSYRSAAAAPQKRCDSCGRADTRLLFVGLLLKSHKYILSCTE